jgi:uncharacterized HAD superfamily protein
MPKSQAVAAAASRPIYVDLDDVLSETIEPLIALLDEHFGRSVSLEQVRDFDLTRSFGLEPEELDELLQRAHEPEQLASFVPKPGAAQTLAAWTRRGHGVSIMTGRPPKTAAASRQWLRRHAMPHERFACVDKYGRPDLGTSQEPCLGLDRLGDFGFVLAVEDSAAMALHLAEHCRVTVALIDRPWNRDLGAPPRRISQHIVRCHGWSEVAERFPAP